jgi:hypothetical protein
VVSHSDPGGDAHSLAFSASELVTAVAALRIAAAVAEQGAREALPTKDVSGNHAVWAAGRRNAVERRALADRFAEVAMRRILGPGGVMAPAARDRR